MWAFFQDRTTLEKKSDRLCVINSNLPEKIHNIYHVCKYMLWLNQNVSKSFMTNLFCVYNDVLL